jgi:phosphonate transport system permease protein
MERPTRSKLRSPWLGGLLSLLLPGLGQVVEGNTWRGIGLLATIMAVGGLNLWKGTPLLFVPLAALWLWGVWDAFRRAQGRRSGTTVPFLLAALVVYALGARATEMDFTRLFTGWPKMGPIVQALVHPDLLARPTEDLTAWAPLQVPCVSPLPAPALQPPAGPPRLWIDQPCAALGDTITVHGEGFFPNEATEIGWQNPIGDEQKIIQNDQPLVVTTDAAGRFQVSFEVPITSVPLDKMPKPGETQTHRAYASQHRPYGSLQPTETLNLVLKQIGETISLAFLATVLAVVFAVPVSLLASRNLMWGNAATRAAYYIVRTLLNIIRSIESLIWAIIFGVWVGLGPFAGTLALLFHSIAALGKLYSEAIEGIDPGPIEALRATGANWLQVVAYAVLPQFMPSFLGFTLYRWDINVRMATVIGLICNAGLGFLVIQWVHLNQFNALATAVIAIVLVVAILDYLSAALRKRVLEGAPAGRQRELLRRHLQRRTTLGDRVYDFFARVRSRLGGRKAAPPEERLLAHPGRFRRYALPAFSLLLFIAIFVWSWSVAEIDLGEFVTNAPAGLRMARDMLMPDLVTEPTEEITTTAVLPVPCGVAAPVPLPTSGPRVELSAGCGAPGDPLVIGGHDLPPSTRVYVRWVLPDGSYLRVKENCCDTDAQGELRLETRINAIMEVQPGSKPGQVAISWKRVIGGPQPSESVKVTVDLAVVTLLMALMATTIASLIAVPLSFLAARNIMGRTVVGRVFYNFFRLLFNLWRSIEPMILVVICAVWVGLGPFAGVLALMLNNVPNLGKLFSETIEEIDTGPVEALSATGANRLQTLVYAVVPQLVPRFLAYILYQWDINIRMSGLLGYVGGGGLGQKLFEYVAYNQYSSAATVVWAIVIMVWSMDYVSARVREKLT